MADITRTDVLTYLEKASMLEISELIKEIEVKFDVKAAAPQIAVAAAPGVHDLRPLTLSREPADLGADSDHDRRVVVCQAAVLRRVGVDHLSNTINSVILVLIFKILV